MKIISIFLFIVIFVNLIAFDNISLKENNTIDKQIFYLSHKKTWLNLLHYKDGKSSIITRNFFLSKDGDKNPYHELKATLKYFKQNKNICKYPARYLWLSKYFNSLDKSKLLKCSKLQNWYLLKNTTDISVVFVSGFLGNPASAFGHSFFKMKQKGVASNLFDTTISYGAKLPKKNNIFLYIFNGLTGGYIAGYSDKYYYLDEMVYSNREFREMWEYGLKLTEEQKKMLIYHLWELRKIHFKYYFLNRNCGYKVSELLDLIYNRKITDNAKVWYAPIETFYKLKEYHFIKYIKYHPSKQQKIYTFYSSLNKKEKNLIYKMLDKNLNNLPNRDKNLSQESKLKILDFMIEYKKYSTDKIPSTLMLNRMRLPISNYKKQKPKDKPPVTDGNKMSYISIGYEKYLQKEFLNLQFSPFTLDRVGYNTLDGDMLSIGHFDIQLKHNRVNLQKFSLIQIRKLKTNHIPFDKEFPLSWEMDIGSYKDSHEDKRDYFFDGGIGYSWKSKKTKYYFMIDTSLHSTKQHIRINPKIGLYLNLHKFRANLEIGNSYDKNLHLTKKYQYDIDIKYHFQKQKSIYIDIDNQYKRKVSAGFKFCF